MSQTQAEYNRKSTPGTPRWVKVFGLIALILIVILGILHFGGGHGPGSHLASGETGGATMPTSMMGESTPLSGNGG